MATADSSQSTRICRVHESYGQERDTREPDLVQDPGTAARIDRHGYGRALDPPGSRSSPRGDGSRGGYILSFFRGPARPQGTLLFYTRSRRPPRDVRYKRAVSAIGELGA